MTSRQQRAQAEVGKNPSLRELQTWMVERLQHDRDLAKTDDFVAESERVLTGNDGLLPVETLEIYREQYWLRHTGALLDDFPGLSGILGQKDWERLVQGYLGAHSPGSFTLRDLGAALPGHIEQATYLPHHSLCVDMARLEWAYVDVFDALDTTRSLDADRLGAMTEADWETAQVMFAPAATLLKTRFSVAPLRRQLKRAAAIVDDGGKAPDVPLPKRQNAYMLLYRDRQRNLNYAEQSRGAFALLGHLMNGDALVPACGLAGKDVPSEAKDIPGKVGDWFAHWGKLGVIVDVVGR